MSYTTKQIADWFISQVNTEAGDTISPLKLQKLMYYAQAWHLVNFSGKPLFDERIEAWRHGPVVPSIYSRFKELCMECQILPTEAKIEPVEFPKEITQLLTEVREVYGEHSASFLEALTHSEKPWQEARDGCAPYERCNNEISHKAMLTYYASLSERGEA